VFVEPAAYLRYVRILHTEAARPGLQVWAYCLMPNHVHLIVVVRDPTCLARTIRRAHGQYAQWVNARQGWSGHLWANRFYSAPMDDAHLWAAVRYVESNPVRAGLTAKAEDYRWSSARAHAWGIQDSLLAPIRPFPGDVPDWRAWLAEYSEEAVESKIRSRTVSGLPLGDSAFVAQLEREVGRRLTPGRRGRQDPGSE
jgi:putative transposase